MKACIPRSLLLGLSWMPYSFVTQKALAILMSPKATYAAALDEMSPCAGSSALVQSPVGKEQCRYSLMAPRAATRNGEQLMLVHHELRPVTANTGMGNTILLSCTSFWIRPYTGRLGLFQAYHLAPHFISFQEKAGKWHYLLLFTLLYISVRKGLRHYSTIQVHWIFLSILRIQIKTSALFSH